MPNWIEGTLKLRGTSDALKNFFKNAILPCANYTNRDDFIKCHFENDDCSVWIAEDAYIEGTHRAFVSEEAYPYFNLAYDTVAIPIKQAWGFDVGDWLEIANKYDLDVRLYGFECGMEFTQDIEIMKVDKDDEARVVTRNLTQTYDDYIWECPMPLIGG